MTTRNGGTLAHAEETERVLLVIGRERNRELLASWLETEYEVATATPDDDWGSFDVCVVDAASYDEARTSLVAQREAASPMFLPVLLLLPEDQRGMDWVGREVGETVDQVLQMPTKKRFLRSHLDSLLRTRRLSRELAEQREQLRVYRRAMDEAAVGVIITDPNRPDNPITYVNDRFEELTGYEASEIRGRNCRFLQGPETDAEPVRRMREAIDAGEPVTVELVNYRKDGTPFWNRVTITPVYGEGSEGDEVTCFLGFQEDVTERKELEADLRAETELLKRVFDTSSVGITVLDTEGNIVRANETAEEELGLERSEIVSRTYDAPEWDIVDLNGEPIPAEDLPFSRVMRTGDPVEDYRHGIRVDGETRWLSINAAPLTDEDGNIENVVSTIQDITDRVERERELERYETIVEAAADPIYAVDRDGHYTLANDAYLQLFDMSREELYGTDSSELLTPETYDAFDELVGELLGSDERQRTVEVPVTLDGERRLFEINVALLTRDDEFRGSIGVARDITDLRERERRLTVLDRVLRHNLRNKLNIVLAHAEAVTKETDDVGLREHAEGIEHAGEQLLALSEQARRFQDSIDPGRGDVTTVDVTELAAHVVDAARDDHPEADVAVDLPAEAWARAPGTPELALAELVENAVKHNDRERPTVRVAVTSEADGVVVRVADDGPGFGDMERRVLLRGTESPLEHMQGVGLWLVRWTVTGAGGDLDIEENDPRGSVVTVRLPRATHERADGGSVDGDSGRDSDGNDAPGHDRTDRNA